MVEQYILSFFLSFSLSLSLPKSSDAPLAVETLTIPALFSDSIGPLKDPTSNLSHKVCFIQMAASSHWSHWSSPSAKRLTPGAFKLWPCQSRPWDRGGVGSGYRLATVISQDTDRNCNLVTSCRLHLAWDVAARNSLKKSCSRTSYLVTWVCRRKAIAIIHIFT